MLTKDLLKFRKQKGKIIPSFIPANDVDFCELASALIDVFKKSEDLSFCEIQERLDDLKPHNSDHHLAFEKLLFSRCQWEDSLEEIEKKRWEIIELAQSIRTSENIKSLAEYEELISDNAQEDPSQIRKKLYSDLPEHKKLKKFKPLLPEELCQRYNCAQVQGLLLRSSEVMITLSQASTEEQRLLFRFLKFHQIIARVQKDEENSVLEVEFSGPLSLFDSSQSYGMRIANFFPRLLLLKSFQLEASIKLTNKTLSLILDENCGIKSHYKDKTSYIPEEFTTVINQFNKKYPDYKNMLAEDFIDLGRQSYCFPDMKISNSADKKSTYFEFFHRWHYSQLKDRLKTLEKSSFQNLRLGVCKSLLGSKKYDLKEISESSSFKKHCFTFRDFPTSKQLFENLEEHTTKS